MKKPLGKDVIIAENISKSYDRPIFKDFTINITKGEKIAIIGTNGVGKTTLLKTLMKQIEPDAGKVSMGDSVTSSVFPQDHREGILEDSDTLVEWLYRYADPGTEMEEIRAILGRMLFSGDMAKKIHECSFRRGKVQADHRKNDYLRRQSFSSRRTHESLGFGND